MPERSRNTGRRSTRTGLESIEEQRERWKREYRELLQQMKWLDITGEERERRIREWFQNRRLT